MVGWLSTKERMSERGSYTLATWSCANKQNKSMRLLIFSRMVVHKRKSKWKRTICFPRMVVCKVKANEIGSYVLVKWSSADKRNKSLRTITFGQIVVHKRKYKWKRTIYFGQMVVCKRKNKWKRTIYFSQMVVCKQKK